ncbi:DUF6893 family small protein [Actinokineospora sp.]
MRRLFFLLTFVGLGAAIFKLVGPDIKRYLDMRKM